MVSCQCHRAPAYRTARLGQDHLLQPPAAGLPADLLQRPHLDEEACRNSGFSEGSVVGVVTKDVPANVIVVGNPARVLRQITEDDDRFEGGKPIPQAMLDKYK